MARAGLVERFKEAGLDPARVVVNGGVGTNIGGFARHGEMTAWCVSAVHSNFLGFPPVGFLIEIGGVRFYCSGDLALVGRRYRPDVALVCIGDNAFAMGPDGAALAVELLGCRHAVPIHYAHNPDRSRGPDAGPEFAELVRQATPNVRVHVLKPGESVEITGG